MRMTVPVRVLIAVAFLVGVNLASGLLAVEFGYPSLWGSSEVFAEYAYPVPLAWAFAHWWSMLPLAWVVYEMWEWPRTRMHTLRWSLAAAFVIGVLLEIVYGGGRWHRIPFVLFILVDLSAVFVLSLQMSRRGLIVALPVGVLSLLAWMAVPVVLDAADQRNRKAEFERIVSRNALVRPVSVERVGDQTVYAIEIVPYQTVASENTICHDAISVYEEMLRLHEPEEKTLPLVQFSKPGNPVAIVGTAHYTTHGRWLCQLDL